MCNDGVRIVKYIFFFQAEDGIRDAQESRGLGDVYKRQVNKLVAGSVVLETNVIGKIRGIQFLGIVSEPEGELASSAREAYLRRFPVAMLMDTHLWVVKLTYIKMTDNRLGFGKKLIWENSK